MTASWFAPPLHDARRSVALVRLGLAIVLASHPVHALLHGDDAAALAALLGNHGLPAPLILAWAALLAQLACCVMLCVPRLVGPGALGAIAILVGGIAFAASRHWFVVGGFAVDGEPGIEFHVLAIGLLAGVAWASRDSDAAATRGMQIIRIASAASLVPHGIAPYFDPAGMHGWGEAMSQDGYPYGVAMVWGLKVLELISAGARIAGRFVVPAAIGNLIILIPGMWIAHQLAWFVTGPGENGVEFSVLLIVGAVASILAYAPRLRVWRVSVA